VRVLTEQADLSAYTTLRLGGPAARFTEVDSAGDLIGAVRAADAAADPVLVLGGGSNLVVADEGFDGTVVRVATSGVRVSHADGDSVAVTVAAGENWARVVDWAVAEQFVGIECLAGIPGLAGATPIQNVGAYGQEVAATISSVLVFDRATGAERTIGAADCGFGYRTSVFKTTPWPPAPAGPTGRYVVLDVTFTLATDPMSKPVKYPELAARLGVSTGGRALLADVRDAVIGLRRGKGMVLDPADADTASAGSFFTNPVISLAQLAEVERRAAASEPGRAVPRFPADDGQVKVLAAWLIEHAGFAKGFGAPGPARISSKHTLALTNAGGATTADVIALARQIVAGVRDAFGVTLTNEPTLVGVAL
jgi:UDP-N-acetylmuramate dehydrogenase